MQAKTKILFAFGHNIAIFSFDSVFMYVQENRHRTDYQNPRFFNNKCV